MSLVLPLEVVEPRTVDANVGEAVDVVTETFGLTTIQQRDNDNTTAGR